MENDIFPFSSTSQADISLSGLYHSIKVGPNLLANHGPWSDQSAKPWILRGGKGGGFRSKDPLKDFSLHLVNLDSSFSNGFFGVNSTRQEVVSLSIPSSIPTKQKVFKT
jgi:hypothetical protein